MFPKILGVLNGFVKTLRTFSFLLQKAPFVGGGIALNITDNILTVHHRSSGTSGLFDVALSVESDGQVFFPEVGHRYFELSGKERVVVVVKRSSLKPLDLSHVFGFKSAICSSAIQPFCAR